MGAGHHHHGAGEAHVGKLWVTLARPAHQQPRADVHAAHMFTDVAALAVSLAAIRIARRGADHKRTFGYYRFEILAAGEQEVLHGSTEMLAARFGITHTTIQVETGPCVQASAEPTAHFRDHGHSH